MLESTLAHCVVFHDHLPQTGQYPILILASYHVNSDLYEGAGEAASFQVENLLKPRPNVAAGTLPPTLHPAATKRLLETNSDLTYRPLASSPLAITTNMFLPWS